MKLRKIFKSTASLLLVPATRWYLRKERNYHFRGIKIKIPPTVFHPGLFPSTRFLLSFLEKQELASKSFLELGCGTGLISVWAAQQKAIVTACDLNPIAVLACEMNSRNNGVKVKTFHSDLFDVIPQTQFDWVVINPPYYARNANDNNDLAWNCGENFEYFKKLFFGLPNYIHPNSQVIMVLTQACDISAIQRIAHENKFVFELRDEQKVLFDERDFIFGIKSS